MAGMMRKLQKVKYPLYSLFSYMICFQRSSGLLGLSFRSVVGSLGIGKVLSLAWLFYVVYLGFSKLFVPMQ